MNAVGSNAICCSADREEHLVRKHTIVVQCMLREISVMPYNFFQAIACEANDLRIEVGIALLKTHKVKVLVLRIVSPLEAFQTVIKC